VESEGLTGKAIAWERLGGVLRDQDANQGLREPPESVGGVSAWQTFGKGTKRECRYDGLHGELVGWRVLSFQPAPGNDCAWDFQQVRGGTGRRYAVLKELNFLKRCGSGVVGIRNRGGVKPETGRQQRVHRKDTWNVGPGTFSKKKVTLN